MVLGLASGEEKSLPIRVVCIFDLQEVPCTGPESASNALNLVVPPGGAWSRKNIVLPPASPGRHELVLAMFLVPDVHLTTHEFRRDSLFLFEFLRQVIVWGDNTVPDSAVSASTGTKDPEAARGVNVFSLTLTPDGKGHWQDKAEPGADFHVTFNNTDPEADLEVAFVALMDFAQVRFSPEEPIPRRRIRPLSRVSLQGVLPRDLQEGLHEFIVIAVESPYLSEAQSEYLDVDSSRRIPVHAPAREQRPLP